MVSAELRNTFSPSYITNAEIDHESVLNDRSCILHIFRHPLCTLPSRFPFSFSVFSSRAMATVACVWRTTLHCGLKMVQAQSVDVPRPDMPLLDSFSSARFPYCIFVACDFFAEIVNRTSITSRCGCFPTEDIASNLS